MNLNSVIKINMLFNKAIVMGLFLVFLCSPGFAVDRDISGGEKSAAGIIQEVDKFVALKDIESEQVVTVYRKDGSTRQYRLKVMTEGGERAFAEVIGPAREKGIQMLRLGKMVWRYLPNLKKSIRISGRQSFMGSDFRDNEILRFNLAKDYISRSVEELADNYMLMLEGKDSSVLYAKSKMWMRKKDFQPIRQEYFSDDDELIKTVFYQDYRDFGGIKRPAQIEIRSASSPESKTTLELISFREGVNDKTNMFHRCSLDR